MLSMEIVLLGTDRNQVIQHHQGMRCDRSSSGVLP
jgi:hypothetical protein